ncbi:hypothetical protein, partial [Salmonella sp. s58760]|uniref:hypothetical protein n=1 Tax=Salmonella sp. s58760 TaxID=3159708 RepID=UPI0039815474
QLRGLLLNAVNKLLQTVVIDCQTAKEAWEQFKAQLDRETASSTISLLKAITDLTLCDGDDILEYKLL